MTNYIPRIRLLVLGFFLFVVAISTVFQPPLLLAQGSIPNTPSNLRIVGVTESSITIGWDDNSDNEQGFNIYKWNGASFPLFASVGANVTTFTHTGLGCPTSDFYMVSAFNGNGESVQIGWMEGRTICPFIVQASKGIYPDKVRLTWSSSDGATSYEVWRHTSDNFNLATQIASSLTSHSFNDTSAAIGTTYYYWIKAQNSSGTSRSTSSDSGYRRPPGLAENPRWKILILIYRSTDFSYTDGSGNAHHVIATMIQDEIDRATTAATQFFEEDVPALTSGNMYPILTIRYPTRTLNHLDSFCGYWPSEVNTVAERDPAFDSVVVIWDSTGVDLITGQTTSLQNCGGLAQWRGTEQTYATFQVDSVSLNQRNTFKHEWGHSILFYFEATGTAPQPAVNNHINNTNTRYVPCPTGESYRLEDETDDSIIPNSIYNNYVGFTHDYYSGTTATPDQPMRCLGITPSAWAAGGPVTKPTGEPSAVQVYLPIVTRNK